MKEGLSFSFRKQRADFVGSALPASPSGTDIVIKGTVNSIVRLSVLGGFSVSTISNNAVAELGLESGKDALAVIKATSVMIGID